MTEQVAVEGRLKALAALQTIDSQLDRLRQVRGGLPEEVSDLEDEIAGLETRLERLDEEIAAAQKEIRDRQHTIDQNRDMIKRYDSQLMQVKNSREFEALNKEIELANLEILTAERKIKQYAELVDEQQHRAGDVRTHLEERRSDLEAKKGELAIIIAETEKEEERLLQLSHEASRTLEARIHRSYDRIRKNMRNGLAVVTVDRGACGGCFAVIPPQRLHEIRESKRIIVCENCGRILVDGRFFQEGQHLS